VTVFEHGGRSARTKGLGAWLARIAPRAARGDVTIAILPDSKVRRLNNVYRRIDRATDVLSFPTGKGSGAIFSKGPGKLHPTPFLGDIVISRRIAQKQAKILGHSVATEVRVLALHGLLHLLGYDHENDNGRMARTEARLRRKAGLPTGLIARSS
jgi:probable rRNA maturation factor